MSEEYKFYLMHHGLKLYDNGKGDLNRPAFDPPLLSHMGLREAAEILRERKVIQMISSPLLRCRDTAEFVATELRLFRKNIISNEFREFLGNWSQRERRAPFKNNLFDPRTEREMKTPNTKPDNFRSYHTSPVKVFEDNFSEFKMRIKYLADSIINSRVHQPRFNGECIVTHTIVIVHLLQALGCPLEVPKGKNGRDLKIMPGALIEVSFSRGNFYARALTKPLFGDEDNIRALVINSPESPIGSYESEMTAEINSDDELSVCLDNLTLNSVK